MRRMADRGTEELSIEVVVTNGEIIETYPDDTPYPSRLIFAVVDFRPIHVVAADNPSNNETYIITTYEPESSEWDETFTRRRSQ
jgi:Domain of unknown function (DUF4258)